MRCEHVAHANQAYTAAMIVYDILMFKSDMLTMA
jgi:hypothetical protein